MSMTARQLVMLPPEQARSVLEKQEIAYANQVLAKKVLDLAVEKFKDESFERVNCYGIAGDRFEWEALVDCDLCDNTGVLFSSERQRSYDCPACDDDAFDGFSFTTDYDGANLERRE